MSSFYASNMSLDRAKNAVKGSLKALSLGASTENRFTQECETPILRNENTQVHGWTPLLIVAGVITTLGSSVPVGFSIGVMNTPAHIIREFCNSSVAATYGVELSTGELHVLWSCIVSIFLVGGMMGSLCGGWLADSMGRRGAVFMNHGLALLAAVLFVAARPAGSVEMLLLGRFIMGISSGVATSTVPMYLTELAPLSIRGAMGVLCPLGLTVGVLLAQIMGLHLFLGRETTWPYLLALYAVCVVPTGLVLPFLPESPKYLYAVRGQPERAVKELCRLRGIVSPENVSGELEELSQGQSAWSVGRVLNTHRLILPLALVCALQAGQQFSGINAVFYYSVTIFERAGLSHEGSQYATIGAGGVNLLVTVIAIPLSNRCGRRTLLLASCWLASLCLLLLGAAIFFIETIPWMPYVCIVAVLGYVFCYGFGLGPIPYFIAAELFPVGPRPVAMAFGSMANWAGNFLIGMTFPSLQASIGAYSFLLFATVTLLLSMFLRWYLPETLGRTPSLDKEFQHGMVFAEQNTE